MSIDERPFGWVYQVCAIAALAVAILLPSAGKRVPVGDRKTYWILQLVTLSGAIIGAKLVMLMADLGWPARPIAGEQVIFSGRSLVGGLLGGFLAAEAAKPILHYRLPPNDWFAVKLMLSVAIGRVGCLLAGCCRGLPAEHGLLVHYSDGIARHAIAIYELSFHLVLFGVLLWLERQRRAAGQLFALYLVVYGVFRFALEPLRETPKLVYGSSVYQVACVLMVGCGLWSMARTRKLVRAMVARS